MKIVFLCGSLEPGRDGVGDYTRRLAGELVRQGNKAAMIALNDTFIKNEIEEIQQSENVELPVFRIPSIWKESKRVNQAKIWIDAINPTWLSLQFVIFSFQSKGIPIRLSKQLKILCEGRSFHIMFHELWVGLAKRNYIQSYLRSALQKVIIRHMLGFLRPAMVHTHIPVYQLDLGDLGWHARQLPLFSNIEVTAIEPDPIDTKVFRIGFFSQAEVNDPVAVFLANLAKQAAQYEYNLEVLLIGGSEIQMTPIKDQVENIMGYRNKVRYTGYLEPRELSIALQTCTLGLTPVPRHCLGKSGSVAAFIEHGIPVAAPNVHPGYSPAEIGFFSPNLCASVIVQPECPMVKDAKKAVLKASHEIEISTIAKKMQSDLHQSYYE